MTPAVALGLEGTLLVHLNLNHGALEVAARRALVARGYGPLFELLAGRPWLRLALAASAHTLERIARLEPAWLDALRAELARGRIEFLGMGDTTLVGPLVPAAVNRWNQVLGRETYAALLGRTPRVALVNERAWSQGLVDAYLDGGYEAAIAFGPRASPARTRVLWTRSPTGRGIRLLLTPAGAHAWIGAPAGDDERFLAGLRDEARGKQRRHVFLCQEGLEERWARAAAPEDALGQEWLRAGEALDRLHARGVTFPLPEELLAGELPSEEADDADPAPFSEPILLPDEPAGLTRWALAGWDNVGINARCFARAKELERVGGTAQDWQLLCRAWGSDLRAELSERRWRRLARSLPSATAAEGPITAFLEGRLRSRRVERTEKRLALGTDGVRAVLDLRRGLALDALTFAHACPQPIVGRLESDGRALLEPESEPSSGHMVLEMPGQPRVSDLAPVEPEVQELVQCLRVRARVPTARGPLPKEVRVYAQRLEIRYGFSAWGLCPPGSLRVGFVTLLPGTLGDELWLSCANGGPRERLPLRADCDHTRGSGGGGARALLGATDGWLALDDGRRGIELSWPQEEAPALALVTLRREGALRLVRVTFSLAERDGAISDGGGGARETPLHDFRFSIRPYRRRR